MTSFQNQAFYNPNPGIEGDFAGHGLRSTVLAGPAGIIAGAAGVTVGRFAWTNTTYVDDDGQAAVANNFGSGPVVGFVHRGQQALITNYLAESTMLVPSGSPITLFSNGDFWVRNAGATAAQPGMKAYARYSDGAITFAAAGAASVTSFTASVAASTFSATGSIAGNVLTVTAVSSGVVVAGATFSGTGVASGTQVTAQLSGTVGGIGTYAVSIPQQTVASTALSGTYGTMTVTAVASGVLGVGQVITAGTGAVVGTAITALGTGAGGVGTYIVNNNTVVSSAANFATATNVETKWFARSYANVNELLKISSWAQG